MTIGTLMSRDLCYHGYETASRRISGFYSISLVMWSREPDPMVAGRLSIGG